MTNFSTMQLLMPQARFTLNKKNEWTISSKDAQAGS